MENRDQREGPLVEPERKAIGGRGEVNTNQRPAWDDESIELAQTIDIGLDDLSCFCFIFRPNFDNGVVFSIEPSRGYLIGLQERCAAIWINTAFERGYDDPSVRSGPFGERARYVR